MFGSIFLMKRHLYVCVSLDVGIIMLLAVPLFDQSNKWCINLPNIANLSFHFPTVLRVYMLAFIPGNEPLYCVYFPFYLIFVPVTFMISEVTVR